MKLLSTLVVINYAMQVLLLLTSSKFNVSQAAELRGSNARNLMEEEPASSTTTPKVGDVLTLSRVVGGGQQQPHQASLYNESPHLGVNYIIAVSGEYPQYSGGQQTTGPMLGEIKMFAGSYAPAGWAFCEGQLIAVNSNSALFSILGTTYGGDGRNTFGLPDLRGRVPVHPDQHHSLGLPGGVRHTKLSNDHLPTSAVSYALESSTNNNP